MIILYEVGELQYIIGQRMIEVPDNDIEYYQRKVVRMEQDICILQDELNRVRIKLRTAEDFEIKYRILLKNNEVDLQRARIEAIKNEEARSREKIAEALKQNDEHWMKVKQDLEMQLQREAGEHLEKVSGQLQLANRKLKDISQKKEEMDLFSFKIRKYEKENAALEQQLADIKRACEREKNEQLTQLRNQLNAGFRQRLAAQRQSNQARIQSLTKKLVENQTEDTTSLQMPDISNAELVALRDLYAATKASHEKEIDHFQQAILRKNTEIKSLLREQSERQQKWQQILSSKNRYVSQLQEEMTRIRKQQQQEVLELGRRLEAVKQSEGQILKEQLREMSERCKEKEAQLLKQSQAYSQQVQAQTQLARNDLERIANEKDSYEKTIKELNERLKEKQSKIAEITNQLNTEKSKQLHANGEEAGQYQNGILFLQRQLRKSQQRNQESTRLYAKLQADFQVFRNDTQEEVQQLHQKLKSERIESDKRIRAGDNQVRQLVDQLTAKSQQLSHIKKQFISEKLSLEVQVRTLTGELEEIQSDYNRLQQVRKALQSNLKAERSKRHGFPDRQDAFKDINNDLQGLSREKEEHLLRKHQESLRKINDQLRRSQQKVRELQLENNSLKKAQQRLYGELQSNKQNARTDREKKIATIELQLARKNNIYQALIENQSRSLNEPSNLLSLSRRDKGEFLTPRTSK